MFLTEEDLHPALFYLTEVKQMIVFVILNELKYLKIIQNRSLEILRSSQNDSFA